MPLRNVATPGGMAFGLCLLAAAALAAADADPVQAAWQEEVIDFVYIGRTSFYSCHSLEDKIEWVLKELGVRKDVVVRSTGCLGQFVPETFMSVRIKAAVPKVIDPEAALDPEEQGRRELIARVRGESGADAVAQAAEPFPAAWTTVSFSRKSRYIDDGDCELMEQLQYRVFPKLGIRVLREVNWCIPGQIRIGQLNLEVEALKALPTPDDPR